MKVIIGGTAYAVSWVDDIRLLDHNDDQVKLHGQISYQHQSIRIHSGSLERQRITLLHEVIHAAIEEYSIRELMDGKGDHMESPVNQLAHALHEALASLGIVLPTKP